ncbi:hypothetical protein HUF15_00725 [Streptomyces samsunensis]|uniref:hypothetical protein n=1 Tax=Streptomyces malaysiensis TaxID=92644 RepID=UPI0015814D5E|nr:hypothetical protein [Streptomyces samsunensis]NUH35305.1 hypothetical protein [Streptomyces samsunensis]
MSNPQQSAEPAEVAAFLVQHLGGRGHWPITSPSGETITAPKTPHGGNRSLANMRANLKRLGARL